MLYIINNSKLFFYSGCNKNLESLHIEMAYTNYYNMILSEILSVFQYPDRIYLPELDSVTKVTYRTDNGNNRIHLQFLEGFVHLLRQQSNVLWVPHAYYYPCWYFYSYESTAATITGDFRLDDILGYEGLHSVCVRPPDKSCFLMEATTSLLQLKLISCSYDPKV